MRSIAGVDLAAGEQRRQGRGEAQPPVGRREVERLDAEAVAAEDDPAGLPLVDREGEHAVEARDEIGAEGVIGLQQHLGIALREERVAARLEFGAEFLVIVDAAVEDDGQPERGVGERLTRCVGQVDDLEAAMAEGDAVVSNDPHAIGPARCEAVGHPFHRHDISDAAVEPHFTRKSTQTPGLLLSLRQETRKPPRPRRARRA